MDNQSQTDSSCSFNQALTFVGLFVLMFLGCDQSFDPRGALDKQMVVFAVLSTDRDVQYVRVQTGYMPPDYNPLSYSADPSLKDASVFIIASGKTYQLRDTLLAQPDTNRYKYPLRSYYLASFTPQRGRSYDVEVHSPSYGNTKTTVLVPGSPKISLVPEAEAILDQPDKNALGAFIGFNVQLSQNTKGFIGRFLLYYDVLKGSEWVEEAVEIPVASSDSSSFSLNIPKYPGMTAVTSTSQIGIVYRNGYYKGTINKLNSHYSSTQLICKWVTFVVLQADKNLYEYYVSTHPSLDPYSIRLEPPTVSGVNGGLGVVGAYSLDSLVYLLPYDFWGNRLR